MRAVTGKIFNDDFKIKHPFTAILTGSSGVRSQESIFLYFREIDLVIL